jgi:trehalose-phosphatase
MTRLPGLKIAVISGRSLRNLRKLVPIPGLIYAGNHGLEFKLGRGTAIYPEVLSWKPLLRKLARKLERPLRPFKGIWVENKGVTLSIHYRCLLSRRIETARKILMAILRSRQDFSKLIVRKGKKVWEIQPPVPWDKGHMVIWLLAQAEELAVTPSFSIYIGDDRTDEDAFKVLKQKGLGIKVTRHPSKASVAAYYLRSPHEVFIFLKRVKDLRERKARNP